MAIVGYVDFYPPTGWPDRPWHDDPACDALVKSGRRVVEAYSAAITDHGLVGPSSEVRVSVPPARGESNEVEVDVSLDFLQTFDHASASIPAGVLSLNPRGRAEVALSILDAVMRALALEREWDLSALDAALAAVRRDGLEYTWHGPWKASPSRRREARGTFWLEDDGYGRAVIEVRQRGVEGATISRTPDVAAFCTSAGFVRGAKALRWTGEEVGMKPHIGLLGPDGADLRYVPEAHDGNTGTLVGRLVDPAESEVGVLPRVVVSTSRSVPDSPKIVFCGGGPTNGLPGAYRYGLDEHLDALVRNGTAWWSGADRNLLEITYFITDGDPDVRVRRLKDRVTAEIRRPLRSTTRGRGRKAARQDVERLIEKVSKRMKLEGAPSIDLDVDDG